MNFSIRASPSTSIEPLISINNQLERPEAAVGILRYAQNPDNGIDESLVDAQETTPRWYEKLGRWDDALEAYERKQRAAPDDLKYTFARLRCLKALGEWKRLSALSCDLWQRVDDVKLRRQVAPLAARAAWAMGRWDDMERYVRDTSEHDVQGAFFRAVLGIHNQRFRSALRHIGKARRLERRQKEKVGATMLCRITKPSRRAKTPAKTPATVIAIAISRSSTGTSLIIR